jgi:hypothetical protein
MDRVRAFGWAYFVMFMAIVGLDFVPAFVDAEGRLFGLFTLDFYDNALHFASGLWAGIAAWLGRGAARAYFRLFGPLYFLDGLMGLAVGSGFLDFGIFLYGTLDLTLTIRFLANLPHLLIGGIAAFVGYVLAAAPAREEPAAS